MEKLKILTSSFFFCLSILAMFFGVILFVVGGFSLDLPMVGIGVVVFAIGAGLERATT